MSQLGCDILPMTKSAMPSSVRNRADDAEHDEPSLGWMVGWAEKGDASIVFALNMDCRGPRHIADRTTLTQACLTEIGVI